MQESLSEIRRLATQKEVDLHRVMQALAGLVAPPFTPKRRSQILTTLASSEQTSFQLHALWTQALQVPEAQMLSQYHDDVAYFAALRRRLNFLIQLRGQVYQVMKSKPLPIQPDTPVAASPTAEVLRAFEAVLYRIHDHLSPPRPDPEAYEGKHFDIPLPFTQFARLAQLARRTALAIGRPLPLSFIDVGCGVGLKVLQAAQVFEVAQGLEYDPTRVPVADGLVQNQRRDQDKVFQADALTFDGYDQYDVIYAYKPLSSHDLIVQMEQRIIEQARPGTVLVMPYTEFGDRWETYDVGCIAPMVYVTGWGGKDMKPLLRKIGQIGFIVPQDASLRNFDEGFTAPLAGALRRWGHLS